MFVAEPITLNFTMPARDHLGRNGVVGKISFTPDHVELDWRLEENVFRPDASKVREIHIPYGEVSHVSFKKKWFRFRELHLHIADPSLTAEIPGDLMGKLILQINERSRKDIDKVLPLIDFKRSQFVLDAQEQRLESVRAGVPDRSDDA